ncbi:MAG: SDR family oxidoreductase, partial [Leptonema sp. (in: Bacteria)]|nr:SDR family oxidoreductase [Leptonema sp. (in: bacteria)]
MKPNFKTALILGAGSDMAKAFAHHLAKQNINLILAGRQLKELQSDASDIKIRYSVNVDCVSLDVCSAKSRQSLFQGLTDNVTFIASFVGFLGNQTEAEQSDEKATQILDANFTGVALTLERAAQYLEGQSGHRVIVGISSVAGDRGRKSNYLYGSAKAGFTAYLSGLRNRLYSQGIHVLTVKPGFVRTSMTAGMPLPKPITASPEKTAVDIYKAVLKKKNTIYTLWIWRYIMCIIRSIPEFLFKRLSL